MPIPMPSPRGTNYARLFLPSGPTMAFDSATGLDDPDTDADQDQEAGPGGDTLTELLTFLRGALGDDDYARAEDLVGQLVNDTGGDYVADEPSPTPGTPRASRKDDPAMDQVMQRISRLARGGITSRASRLGMDRAPTVSSFLKRLPGANRLTSV